MRLENIMQKTKVEWIAQFRKVAEIKVATILTSKPRNDKAKEINTRIKEYKEDLIKQIQGIAHSQNWNNKQLLDEILMITYASYIVMLEYRNKVWEYEYMAFARRIGELWEPFCKLLFEYPIKDLKIIEPLNFSRVQSGLKKQAKDFISALNVSVEEKRLLSYYYGIPWTLVDSGGIKLDLDLHFEQDGVHYNCDFKRGFSSNEKGNTNRLLLVGSIYQSLGKNEKTLLFVRQDEDQNNHYLQTLKNSDYWSVFCANSCYDQIAKFTGFDLRSWLDINVDWKNDISSEFRKHLENNDLLRYLTW